MSIGFVNLYQSFIQSFSRIAISFIFLLNITKSFDLLALKMFRTDNDKVVDSSGNRTNEIVINISKKLMHMLNIGAIGKPNFLTPNAKKVFNHLQLAFIKL